MGRIAKLKKSDCVYPSKRISEIENYIKENPIIETDIYSEMFKSIFEESLRNNHIFFDHKPYASDYVMLFNKFIEKRN